jgi:hypothetical protein
MLAATVAVCVLVACGGEQVAGIQGSGAPTAASTPTTVVGTITGFGSIFVDGVEYATSGAQIRIDDQPATESQLRVGQVVTVKGSVNADGTTGTATDVSFSGDVQGAVTQVDVDGGTFVVLGQTVRVTDATLFDEGIQPRGIEGLQTGAVVEVSGFPNAAGELVASRVDFDSAGASLQVKGTVHALDTGARTFRINTLTVDYSGVMPVGTLTNESVVNVQGTMVAATGRLLATRVEVSSGLRTATNEHGQVEGVITSFTSKADFVVNGQRVATDGNTQFELHGLTLAANAVIKAGGTFNSSGVLVASKVEAKPQTASVVRGLVDSVSASSSTLTVLGVNFTTTPTTSFEDKSKQHLRPFRLGDLRTGDYVEVRGTPNPTGSGLRAAIVERDKAEDHSYLQGVAINVAEPNLTVLGITVITNAQTSFPGRADAGTFFREAPNQIVKIRGTLSGGVFVADQIRILH